MLNSTASGSALTQNKAQHTADLNAKCRQSHCNQKKKITTQPEGFSVK